MGWFDDNHYAGEAYNFGMGYSSLFLSPAGSSDDNSDDYGYSPYSDDEPYYGEYFRYRAAAMQVGGRSAVTGKYFFGTRKCSVCLRLKTKSDFSADEADQSAAKRCCTTCSQTIIDAMRSLDEKSKRDAVAVEFKVQSPPEPDNATIVVGKTHRVYGPDNSSFVTCSCGCKESAPASMWYQGLKKCEGMTEEVLKTFQLVQIIPKKGTKGASKTKLAAASSKTSEIKNEEKCIPTVADVKQELASRGISSCSHIKPSLLLKLHSKVSSGPRTGSAKDTGSSGSIPKPQSSAATPGDTELSSLKTIARHYCSTESRYAPPAICSTSLRTTCKTLHPVLGPKGCRVGCGNTPAFDCKYGNCASCCRALAFLRPQCFRHKISPYQRHDMMSREFSAQTCSSSLSGHKSTSAIGDDVREQTETPLKRPKLDHSWHGSCAAKVIVQPFTCKYCGIQGEGGSDPTKCAAQARWGACCLCARDKHQWIGWAQNGCARCHFRASAASLYSTP